jgi:hypothetical protein
MFNTIVGAVDALSYGSGSHQMMRLLASLAPQLWYGILKTSSLVH